MLNPFRDRPDIVKLREEYEEKFHERAPGIHYEDFEDFESYKKYLQKKIEEKSQQEPLTKM